jgi:hypothetical protein
MNEKVSERDHLRIEVATRLLCAEGFRHKLEDCHPATLELYYGYQVRGALLLADYIISGAPKPE